MRIQDESGVAAGSTATVLVLAEAEENGEFFALMVYNSPRDDKQTEAKESEKVRNKPAGWGLPGGGQRANESSQEAAYREFCEETGQFLPHPERLLLVQEVQVVPTHKKVFFRYPDFLPLARTDIVVSDPGGGVVRASWVSYDDIMQAFEAMQTGEAPIDSKGRRYYASHLNLLYGIVDYRYPPPSLRPRVAAGSRR